MHTPDNITDLLPNEVFVFGSNLPGMHMGGAAFLAKQKFGAVDGIGEGLIGQSYAFPTLNNQLHKRELPDMEYSTLMLNYTAAALPAVRFYLTKVGCGIAGFTEYEMSALFANSPPNIIKPSGW